MNFKRTFKTIAMALVLTVGLTVQAFSEPIDELMQKSGLNKQIEGIPEIIMVSINRAVAMDPDGDNEAATKLKTILSEAYNVADMKATVREYVGANLDAESMAEVLTWLNSDLGKRITKIEEDRSTPEGEMKRQEFLKNIDTAVIDPERKALSEQFDEAVSGTDRAMDIGLNTQKAMLLSAMQNVPADQRLTARQIDQKMEMSRPMMKRQFQGYMINSMIYTYQDLTIEEFTQYLEFAKSPAGIKYHDATGKGLNVAMTASARTLGAGLQEAVMESEEESIPEMVQ